jgi:hypothetical protein
MYGGDDDDDDDEDDEDDGVVMRFQCIGWAMIRCTSWDQ